MRRVTGHVRSLSTAWRACYASHQQSAAKKVVVLDNLHDSRYEICFRRIISIPISYLTSACGYVSWSNAAYCSTAAAEHKQAEQQQATGSADAESHEASIKSIKVNSSSNSGGVRSSDSTVIATQHHINQISIDELLHNRPLAAQTSAAANTSSSSSSSSKVKSQQELTEQLMSELFDAELEQRLLSAAAAARHTATTTSSSTTADTISLEDTEETVSGFAPSQSYQQQQQQRSQHQPGVTPAPAYAAPSSSSSSSSSPSRIATWHPSSSSSSSSDPWAPLPGPAAARRQLANQLQHLLKQAGVSAELAAAAVTAAAAAAASDQQQQRPQGTRQNTNSAAAAAAVDYKKVFSRLRTQQLVHLLDDCQAPTYGSKGLLVQRIALLLREQYTLQQQQQQQQQQHQQQQGVGPPGTDPGKQHVMFDTWLEGEAGFVSSSSSSSSSMEAADNAPKQQQSGDARIQQVAAAAAARQQLLDNVLDVDEIGGWLLAARAQDVCIVDVRGRAGLHEQLVIASGVSQRHAHACAEAIAWQIREKAQQHVQQQQQQQDDLRSSLSNLLPMLKVLGDPGADWAVLDTGKVVVHVLTERARRFYNLEGLWGGAQGRFVRWLEHEQVVETKDTIGRDIRG